MTMNCRPSSENRPSAPKRDGWAAAFGLADAGDFFERFAGTAAQPPSVGCRRYGFGFPGSAGAGCAGGAGSAGGTMTGPIVFGRSQRTPSTW